MRGLDKKTAPLGDLETRVKLYKGNVKYCGTSNASKVNGKIKMYENSLGDSLWQHKMRERVQTVWYSCLGF